MTSKKKNVPREQIAHQAYKLWEARGRPPGDGVEDWLAVELKLLGDTRQRRIVTLKKFFAVCFARPRLKAA